MRTPPIPQSVVTIFRAIVILVALSTAGSAQFTPALGSPVTAANPSSVVPADFNEDGILDLAVANFNAGTIMVLLGNGTGGFAAATGVTPAMAGAEPVS